VSVEYLDLADYLAIAAEVTGLDIDTVIKVTNLDLTDSALHAPSAGFNNWGSPTYGDERTRATDLRVLRNDGHGARHRGASGTAEMAAVR
jgi:hypothetical protein